MGHSLIFALGFTAQILFSARILIQWIMSEKAKRVVSPTIFWILSIIAAYMLFIYGWLRDDFAIMLGQLVSYYIYIWNLYEKKFWKKIPALLRVIINITPVIGVLYILYDWHSFYNQCFNNDNIPILLLMYGSLGQLIFTLRFVYQYLYSSKIGESILPKGFWIISLIGSSIIVTYGILRLDPVIILGQSFGFASYIRNIT
ncbi:MAG: lipid-A-disaccharide synthase N-terminal domain-containing protein, partial [Bacteroidales bacterium]